MKSRILKSLQVGMLLVAAIVGVVALQAQPTVHAQSSANTLKVSPVRTDITIQPGESKVVKITVTNLTSEEVTVRPFENDFIAGDESGTPSVILDEDEYAPTHSLKRFLSPLENVTIPANSSAIVEVNISVPADTQAGGYFGAIRFGPTDEAAGGQVNANTSLASLILLSVPGDLVEDLELTDFAIVQGDNAATNFRTPNDLKVSFRFENQGNVQIGPFGKISVTGWNDELVYDYDFNDKNPRDVILPDSARRWDVPLENIENFGYYTVSGTFTYGTNNQTIEVVRSFWVIPTAFIIAAIVIVLLIIGGIVWLIFHLKNKQKRTARKYSSGGRLR